MKNGLQILCDVILGLPDHDVQELNGLDSRSFNPVADVVENARQYFARVLFDQLSTADVRPFIVNYSIKKETKFKET